MDARLAEANRVRPLMGEATIKLDRFLAEVMTRYVNKPQVVNRHGHETVRFVAEQPSDAVLLKFARVVSLCRAMLLLMDDGFIQEQCIIQRSLEESNEDILFYSINMSGSGKSEKFEPSLRV